MNAAGIWKISKPFGSRPPEKVKQPEFKPLNMNINTTCRVRLNEYGIEVLQKKAPYKFTISGWRGDTKELTTELWDLMELFGDCMRIGTNKLPFVDNNIQIMEPVESKKQKTS